MVFWLEERGERDIRPIPHRQDTMVSISDGKPRASGSTMPNQNPEERLTSNPKPERTPKPCQYLNWKIGPEIKF